MKSKSRPTTKHSYLRSSLLNLLVGTTCILHIALLTPAQASTWTETRKKLYIIRADFTDVTGEPISQSEIVTRVNTGVSNQIYQMSYGKTWVEAAATPMVVRLPHGTNYYRTNADWFQIHTDAVAAFNALNTGVNVSNYDVIPIAFKSIGMTFGAGVSQFQGSKMLLQQTVTPGEIGGGFSPEVITHEMGHIYGLGHANAWITSDGSVVGAGSSQDAGDPFDIMGNVFSFPFGHFGPQEKSQLNWLTTDQWTAVSTSGTYRVFRIDDAATTASVSRALRINKTASTNDYYWVGYRTAFSNNVWLSHGAYLLWQRTNEIISHLLDTTPASTNGRADAALLIGRTYSDALANVHITPLAQGGTGADQWLDVRVNRGPFPGDRPPVATLAGPTSIVARALATYTVTASDPDSDALAYGWDFGDATPEPSTATITREYAVGGTYTLKVIVSDMKGLAVTQSLVVTVTEPLNQWTALNSGTSANLSDVCVGTTASGVPIVLAVGDQAGTVCSSTNGSNWTSTSLSEVNASLFGVVYDGKRFIACGTDYSFAPTNDYVGAIWTSVNGSNWTRRFTGSTNTVLRGVASNGSTSVAVGEAGTILYSGNGGTNWTRATTTAATNFWSVASGGGGFVAVGGDGWYGGNILQVFTSTNGSQWTDASSNSGVATWKMPLACRFLNDRFVMSGVYEGLRYSLDSGASFQTTDTRTYAETISALAFGNRTWFAAGMDPNNTNADINLVSGDGAYWTPLPTPQQNDRRAAVFFRDTFITVGDGGAIWRSAVIAAPLFVRMERPVVSGSQVRLDVTLRSGSPSAFTLERLGALPGSWSNDTAAVFTTNVPGSSYRFTTTTNGAPRRFYRVKVQ